MSVALDALRARLAELADLAALGNLAGWDQRTIMPAAGAASRARQLATLARLSHDRAVADEIGQWLDELEATDEELSPVDRDIIRLARRDYDRHRCVPAELAAELAAAAATGESVWERARDDNDFDAFAPFLAHNVELARAYAACFPDAGGAYDALLADYDFGLTAARIAEIFAPLEAALPALVAEGAARPPVAVDPVPFAVQRTVVRSVLHRVGVDEEGWRIDVSAHPFTSWVGSRDTRLTTRYVVEDLQSLLAALHEFGHGLYERQVAPELDRTNLGSGTSMSVHESQSKLWEDHVCRHRAFAVLIADELRAAGHAVESGRLHQALTEVRPSTIRVVADPVSYPLHILLRFELERALIEGTLAVDDLPGAFDDGLRRLLGVVPKSAAEGVLQDVHWAGGSFGYFPSYALGCLIAAQLWETLERDLGPQDDALRGGDVAPLRAWLGDRVHRHGRRLDTEPLVRQATGAGIDSAPFLRHATALVA